MATLIEWININEKQISHSLHSQEFKMNKDVKSPLSEKVSNFLLT